MKKLFLIGFKDLRLVFRDRAALILMLVAPFALTVGMGFATGRFSGSNGSALSDIPVVIVNLDQDRLGNALVDTFKSTDLEKLVEPSIATSAENARQLVDDNRVAAAVIIPVGFTSSIIPSQAMLAQARQDPLSSQQEPVRIEIYANPARPTGAGVIKAIVDEFISRVEQARISGTTSLLAIPGIGNMPTEQIQSLAESIFGRSDSQAAAGTSITLKTNTIGADTVDFDPLAYLAPGMALMFLMYTVGYGGRSIMAESIQGTLPRLLVSPTNSMQILGGKVLGIFLSGVAQMGILILASTFLFQVKWGDPVGVAALIAAAVFGATGWGMLITALARTPGQVSTAGTATMLIFGLLGGSFINLEQMPAWIRSISNITPNAWGLDGFVTLALGGRLADLGRPILALLIMGTLLFAMASFIFSRSNLMKK
jgi:ABC-2 type transport system permease protein